MNRHLLSYRRIVLYNTYIGIFIVIFYYNQVMYCMAWPMFMCVERISGF